MKPSNLQARKGIFTFCKQVLATDMDSGTNAVVSYVIVSGDDSVKKFEIDQQSGDSLFTFCIIFYFAT